MWQYVSVIQCGPSKFREVGPKDTFPALRLCPFWDLQNSAVAGWQHEGYMAWLMVAFTASSSLRHLRLINFKAVSLEMLKSQVQVAGFSGLSSMIKMPLRISASVGAAECAILKWSPGRGMRKRRCTCSFCQWKAYSIHFNHIYQMLVTFFV